MLIRFNTDILDEVIDWLSEHRPKCIIVIKSTIPIGYTKKTIVELLIIIFTLVRILKRRNIYKDLLEPDRIIVSPNQNILKRF